MSGKPVDLTVYRAEHKDRCQFCGEEEHAGVLACGRIAWVTLYDDGSQMDVYFRPLNDEEDGPEDEPPGAA